MRILNYDSFQIKESSNQIETITIEDVKDDQRGRGKIEITFNPNKRSYTYVASFENGRGDFRRPNQVNGSWDGNSDIYNIRKSDIQKRFKEAKMNESNLYEGKSKKHSMDAKVVIFKRFYAKNNTGYSNQLAGNINEDDKIEYEVYFLNGQVDKNHYNYTAYGFSDYDEAFVEDSSVREVKDFSLFPKIYKNSKRLYFNDVPKDVQRLIIKDSNEFDSGMYDNPNAKMNESENKEYENIICYFDKKSDEYCVFYKDFDLKRGWKTQKEWSFYACNSGGFGQHSHIISNSPKNLKGFGVRINFYDMPIGVQNTMIHNFKKNDELQSEKMNENVDFENQVWCFDNGGKTIDRYSIVIKASKSSYGYDIISCDSLEHKTNSVFTRDTYKFNISDDDNEDFYGQRIKFKELPLLVQKKLKVEINEYLNDVK